MSCFINTYVTTISLNRNCDRLPDTRIAHTVSVIAVGLEFHENRTLLGKKNSLEERNDNRGSCFIWFCVWTHLPRAAVISCKSGCFPNTQNIHAVHLGKHRKIIHLDSSTFWQATSSQWWAKWRNDSLISLKLKNRKITVLSTELWMVWGTYYVIIIQPSINSSPAVDRRLCSLWLNVFRLHLNSFFLATQLSPFFGFGAFCCVFRIILLVKDSFVSKLNAKTRHCHPCTD